MSPFSLRLPLLACVAALVLATAGCGDDDAEPTTTAATTTVTQAPPITDTSAAPTTEALTATTSTTATTTTTTEAETSTTEPGTTSVEIVVSGGVVDGPGTLEVRLGTAVVVVVTADVADEVHLHGYDVFADVGPSSAAVIEFVAEVPGRFELELEDAKTSLLEIEVS